MFSLVLPAGAARIADREANVTAHPASSRGAGELPHILVVEDDPAVLNATRLLLKVEGYRVTAAASLSEAMQRAHEHADVDLLITDYHLGDGQTGLEVIASVRGILGADLRVVIVTGDTSSAVRELQHDERVRMTSKPINSDELLTLLRELLAASSRYRSMVLLLVGLAAEQHYRVQLSDAVRTCADRTLSGVVDRQIRT